MTDILHDYFLPAEWHEQSGVMLTWPHAGTDWRPYLDDITRTYIEMTKAIALHERVLIATPEPHRVEQLLHHELGDDLIRNVAIYQVDSDDTWARDHGPITLLPTGDASTDKHPLMIDFRFNGWGEKFGASHDNAINHSLASLGAFTCPLADNDDFVLEGGSIESDGKGTVFTTSQCLLAPHRNQPLSQQGIEERLKSSLHASRIVWLDHGNLIGDDTDGHIDTIVRTAPNDTILYVAPDSNDKEQYADFVLLEQQLMQLRTADGKPYRLLPLPMPEPVYCDGERLPATYANFLVINGAVLCPTYDQARHDDAALATIAEAFPGRKVIGIDARTIIKQHGSIHCLTMQLPAGCMK